MKKVIVTTTVNQPTEAIRLFDAMKDWELVVVGDQKTPVDYRLDRGFYMKPGLQEKMYPELSNAIGWNCIQRRSIGFVYAVKEMKADVIASIDDDNIPLPGWGEDLMIARTVNVRRWKTGLDAFDPIWGAGGKNFWHRGFPIQLLSMRGGTYVDSIERPDIQVDFWNDDPDVDAICRMISGTPKLEWHPSFFPFVSDKISPFNSQNTFLLREVMPHYFMYPGVGRMDDIWASFHVQQQGFKVIYGEPSVRQIRNPHDLTADMKAEYLGYEHNLEIIRGGSVMPFLPERAKIAFHLYQKHYE